MDGVEELWMQKLKKFNVEIPDMTFDECYNDLFEDCYNYSDLLETLFLFSNNYYMYPKIYQMKLLLEIWVRLNITFPEDRTIVNNTIKAIYQSETKEFKKARTEFIRDKLEADHLISCDDNGKEYIVVYRGVNGKAYTIAGVVQNPEKTSFVDVTAKNVGVIGLLILIEMIGVARCLKAGFTLMIFWILNTTDKKMR